jgi:hypothetical protein
MLSSNSCDPKFEMVSSNCLIMIGDRRFVDFVKTAIPKGVSVADNPRKGYVDNKSRKELIMP